ncbi:hypothetical protein ACK8HX_16450 [Oryzobacter sp. R7]|uniref:hypothetical protein n=1 Tax=Oryzobacter faecalis TaxID=3388656 RepID=UPI00398D3759
MNEQPVPVAAGGAVETGTVMTTEVAEREARAATRRHLRRPVVWRSFAATWVVGFVLAGAAQWVLGPIRPGNPWLFGLSTLLVAGVLVALDAFVALPWRTRRAFRRMVAAQAPPGTPIHASWSHTTWSIGTFAATHTILTSSVTGGTWVEDVLVVDTSTDKFYLVAGELLTPSAWMVISDVLGDRLVDLDHPLR